MYKEIEIEDLKIGLTYEVLEWATRILDDYGTEQDLEEYVEYTIETKEQLEELKTSLITKKDFKNYRFFEVLDVEHL